ncbi:MAG: RNA-binding cell elongation regulator Jag/EloR [Anaerovoracaceae bacterium]|jgi:spoIIIJ-associated protein
MNSVEKWGDDVESAVALALAELKADRDEVEVTVLEEPSRGFLGIGAKLALVRVEKKVKEEEKKEEKKQPKAEKQLSKEKKEEKPKKQEMTIEEKIAASAEKAKRSGNDRPQRKGGRRRNRRDGSRPAPRQDRQDRDVSIEELPELDLRKDFKNLPVVTEHPAMDFLKEVIDKMGLKLDMTAKANDTNVYIELKGEDTGTIIGKRGQTLDAIQYLTSLVVNKNHKEYIKVIVDAEGYRERREKTLERLAERLANKVVRTGKSVRLEPMNPYERKVIHATLQSNPKVTTRSEGLDPYRRVIIELA